MVCPRIDDKMFYVPHLSRMSGGVRIDMNHGNIGIEIPFPAEEYRKTGLGVKYKFGLGYCGIGNQEWMEGE